MLGPQTGRVVLSNAFSSRANAAETPRKRCSSMCARWREVRELTLNWSTMTPQKSTANWAGEDYALARARRSARRAGARGLCLRASSWQQVETQELAVAADWLRRRSAALIYGALAGSQGTDIKLVHDDARKSTPMATWEVTRGECALACPKESASDLPGPRAN
jgi:hypothetical protein